MFKNSNNKVKEVTKKSRKNVPKKFAPMTQSTWSDSKKYYSDH